MPTLRAQLPISSRTDRATSTAPSRASLLECQQLSSTVALVVDLRGGLDQILKMGAGQEIAQVDEFAVVLVFDVDDAPAVGADGDGAAVDVGGLFGADDGKGDDGL